MPLTSLQDVFDEQIADLYSAERQLIGALPAIVEAAADKNLREALEEHLEETQTHVARLSRIIQELRLDPPAETCEGMRGLLDEGRKIMEMPGAAAAKDAALIAAAQRVEHYEIAAYGTALQLAATLDLPDAAGLLERTLDEEAAADERLTKLATGGMFGSGINNAADGRGA